MKLTDEDKKLIVQGIQDRLKNYESQSQMAKSLGLSPAQMTRILKGEINRVISDENFMRIAHELGFDLKGYNWKTAVTPTLSKIHAQLEMCQKEAMSGIMVDSAGVGKTHSAKTYIEKTYNSIYIDCSQVKTKQLLIREMARKFGLSCTGKYSEVYNTLVFYLKTSGTPLIVLDEAGDLAYPAFLELKGLWNASEECASFYMMGADGLRAKVEKHIDLKKVGYTEIFRRFGERFQQVSPFGGEDLKQFKRNQLALVAKANNMGNIQELYAKTGGSLTRLKIEFKKQKSK